MTETVTITRHQAKPEYEWEIVVPEGPTVLLTEEKLSSALKALGLDGEQPIESEIRELPNGGSRSVNVNVGKDEIQELVALGVKTVR